MRLSIRGHPARRMHERGISEQDIRQAIARAHTTVTSDESITYVGPGVDGRDLKVWALPPGYTGDEASVIIKSAAWRDQDGAR